MSTMLSRHAGGSAVRRWSLVVSATLVVTIAASAPVQAADTSISGRVTDDQRHAVAGAEVRAYSGGVVVSTATTATDGSYTVPVGAGSYALEFVPAAGTLHSGEFYANAAAVAEAVPLVVGAGQAVTGIDAILELGGSISGTVTGPDGPVTEGTVTLLRQTGDGGLNSGWVPAEVADVDPATGAYAIHVPAYDLVLVRFAADGLASEYCPLSTGEAYSIEDADQVSVEPGQVLSLDGVLEPGGLISGTVTGPAAEVSGGFVEALAESRYGRLDVVARADVAVDGTYTLRAPALGLALRAGGDGLVTECIDETVFCAAATVTLSAGGVVTGQDFVLGQGGSIGGRVTGPLGESVPGSLVMLSPEVYGDPGGSFGLTAADGSYEIHGILPGRYRVYVLNLDAERFETDRSYTGANHLGPTQVITVVAGGSLADLDVVLDYTWAQPTFSDVHAGEAFAADITWLAAQHISRGNGDGTYGRSEPVTREAMAAFLYRFADGQSGEQGRYVWFSDMQGSNSFFLAIGWLTGNRVANGFADKTFRPSAPIERQAMAAFLYRFAGSPEFWAPAESPFVDVRPSDPFYLEITWLAAEGISTGTVTPAGAYFKPLAPVDRQAMAAFLHRMATNVQARFWLD